MARVGEPGSRVARQRNFTQVARPCWRLEHANDDLYRQEASLGNKVLIAETAGIEGRWTDGAVWMIADWR